MHNTNRTVTATLFWGQGTTYSAWIAALRALVQTLEGIGEDRPGCLQVQVPQAASPLYLDVVEAHIIDLPLDELLWMQLLQEGVKIQFSCKPFFRGPQQALVNNALNPGLEQSEKGPVTAFSDNFANANAYAAWNYYQEVQSTYNYNCYYFRLGDPVGTTTLTNQNPTFEGNAAVLNVSGTVTLAQTSLVAQAGRLRDALRRRLCSLRRGAGGRRGRKSVDDEGLGEHCLQSGGTVTVCGMGNVGTAHAAVQIQINSTGHVLATDGTSSTGASSGALSTNTAHLLRATYDGTTLTCYVDGVSTGTVATAVNLMPTGVNMSAIGGVRQATPSSIFYGTIDEVVFAAQNTLADAHQTTLSHRRRDAIPTPAGITVARCCSRAPSTTGGWMSSPARRWPTISTRRRLPPRGGLTYQVAGALFGLQQYGITFNGTTGYAVSGVSPIRHAYGGTGVVALADG